MAYSTRKTAGRQDLSVEGQGATGAFGAFVAGPTHQLSGQNESPDRAAALRGRPAPGPRVEQSGRTNEAAPQPGAGAELLTDGARGPLVQIGKYAAIQSPGGSSGSTPENALAVVVPSASELEDQARARVARLERWALKAAAESILCRGGRWEALRKCHRYRLGGEVDVAYSAKRKMASYRKLETCHSVWACPVCSAKITERRRLELVRVVGGWRDQGGTVALITLTFPHGAGDDLAVILKKFLTAHRKMASWRGYKDLRSGYKWAGYVRALEVTHGERNGWHPHVHLLGFFEGQVGEDQLERFKTQLYLLWLKACTKQGLPAPSFKHGVDVRLARGTTEQLVAEYVAKFGVQPKKVPTWSAEHELVKGHAKRGRPERSTPWDFLRANLEERDDRAAALFATYADAFKGSHQLEWSKGEAFTTFRRGLVEELTDEQIAEQAAMGEDDIVLASLDPPVWRRVIWARAQGQLLEVASSGDVDRVMDFLHELPDPPWHIIDGGKRI